MSDSCQDFYTRALHNEYHVPFSNAKAFVSFSYACFTCLRSKNRNLDYYKQTIIKKDKAMESDDLIKILIKSKRLLRLTRTKKKTLFEFKRSRLVS